MARWCPFGRLAFCGRILVWDLTSDCRQNRQRVDRSVRLSLVEVLLGLPMELVTWARHSTRA
jgi:hypothetical protein